MRSTFPDRHERDRIVMWLAGVSGGVAFLAALRIFQDRWRCIEARGVRKFSGR